MTQENKPTVEGWEKVDEKFTDQFWQATQGYNDKRNKIIKEFLASSLSIYKAELEKKIGEMMKLDSNGRLSLKEEDFWHGYYNQALTHILKIIKE